MIDCGTCDVERGILCIDCYQSTDDESLPPTYAEYFTWAAWYPTSPQRRRRASMALAAVLTCACLVGAAPATETDDRIRADLAALHAKTSLVNEGFARLQEARRCAGSGLLTDLAAALEGARHGGSAGACTALTRR
jgi:hypothetical protein